MIFALFLCGAVALALPGLRPHVSLQGNPQWFAALDAVALVAGLMSVMVGAAMAAAVGGLELFSQAGGDTSGWHLAPGGAATAVAGAALSCWVPLRICGLVRRAAHGSRACRAEPWLGEHDRGPDLDLVVLPLDRPLAYAVGGSPPQVIISRGLKDCGDEELVAFVVDHERVHVGRKHRRLLLAARAVEVTFGGIPVFRRSALALELALERAADEEAAGDDAVRRKRLGRALQNRRRAWAGSCSPEALDYRGALLSAPARTIDVHAVTAAFGLALLLGTIVATTAHMSTDIPVLVTSVVG